MFRCFLNTYLSQQIFRVVLLVLMILITYQSQALTSVTSNFVQGNAPYLTFDGGRTRAIDTEGLLGITLSNGITFTPLTNPSSASNPIELSADESFADIAMFIPTDVDSVNLNQLVRSPYNYWGDDDGDGQGNNGISATGSLSLLIVDKYNQAVARNSRLDICNAPYKLTLSNIPSTLTTLYGVPNTTVFKSASVNYYISPNAPAKVCFAKPDLQFGSDREISGVDFRGPLSMWNPERGFVNQSINSTNYDYNFPTTGGDHLYFYLEIAGSGPLIWDPVTISGITASMEPNTIGTSVKVTLTGPVATESQWRSDQPNNINRIFKPELPKIFELVGKDTNGLVVVKYGFKLKQWFVNRGDVDYYNYSDSENWCMNIGYHLPKIRDLTNASCQGANSGYWCQGGPNGDNSSPNNFYQRKIGDGFFSEWGNMYNYEDAHFVYYDYWTNENINGLPFVVYADKGNMNGDNPLIGNSGICVSP